MHKFLKFFCGIELYMFRTFLLFIIRSLALYTEQYIYIYIYICHTDFADCLLAGSQNVFWLMAGKQAYCVESGILN